MKTILSILAVVLLLSSCIKPVICIPQPPDMEYTFINKEIGFNQKVNIDLNRDGRRDFSIYTMLVGDAQAKTDYQQYYFGSAEFTEFPINSNEEVPLLTAGNLINAGAYAGHNWWPASDIVMAQKVIPLKGVPYWKGNWQNASHNFLPLRIYIGNEVFYGWAEVSFNTITGTATLHRAAISKKSNTDVRAGI